MKIINKKNAVIKRKNMNIYNIVSYLTRNTSVVISTHQLINLLLSDKEIIRLKIGIDPTGDLHLGHMATFFRVREFLRLIPNTVLDIVLGDITVIANSPDRIRKEFSNDELENNMNNIQEDLLLFFKDFSNRIFFRKNSEWFKKIGFADLLPILRKLQVKTILDKFNITNCQVADLTYPALQAYDSIALNSDIEFGGFDQLCNVLVGREVCKQICILFTLLPSLTGNKMSKSDKSGVINIHRSDFEIFQKLVTITDAQFAIYASAFNFNFSPEKLSDISSLKANISDKIVNLIKNNTSDKPIHFDIKKVFLNKKEKYILLYKLIKDTFKNLSGNEIKRIFDQKGIKLNDKIINFHDKIYLDCLPNESLITIGKIKKIILYK